MVLGGALSETAIFRHLGGRIKGVEGVYRGYIRGIRCSMWSCVVR